MAYTIASYVGEHLHDRREDINAAQLGGTIAHLVENVDRFVVYDADRRIVMTYRKKGLLRG